MRRRDHFRLLVPILKPGFSAALVNFACRELIKSLDSVFDQFRSENLLQPGGSCNEVSRTAPSHHILTCLNNLHVLTIASPAAKMKIERLRVSNRIFDP